MESVGIKLTLNQASTCDEEDTPSNWIWLTVVGVSVIFLIATLTFAILTFKHSRRHVFNVIMLTAALLGRFVIIFGNRFFTAICNTLMFPKPEYSAAYFTAVAYLWMLVVNLNYIDIMRTKHLLNQQASNSILYGASFVAAWGLPLIQVFFRFKFSTLPESANIVVFMLACLLINTFLVGYLMRAYRQTEQQGNQLLEGQPLTLKKSASATNYARDMIMFSLTLFIIMNLIFLDEFFEWYYLEIEEAMETPMWTAFFKFMGLSAPIGLWGCFCFSETTKQRLRERFGKK